MVMKLVRTRTPFHTIELEYATAQIASYVNALRSLKVQRDVIQMKLEQQMSQAAV